MKEKTIPMGRMKTDKKREEQLRKKQERKYKQIIVEGIVQRMNIEKKLSFSAEVLCDKQ